MASKIGQMIKSTRDISKRIVIPFGRIASGSNTKVNVQNTVNGEVRDLKVITPYGVSSCPINGLFAQMIVNDDVNSVCVGTHDPSAPKANAGEIILYSSGGAYIKLGADGSITIHGTRIDIG